MSSDTSLSHQDNEPSAKGKGRYLDIRSLQNPAVEDEPNETEGPQSFLDRYSAAQSLIGPADHVDKSSQNMGVELDSFPKKDNETGGQSVDIPKRPEKHLTKEVLDNHEFAKRTLIDDGSWTGQSALHKACKSGFTENCIELLKRGANPHLKDSNGFVPLHYAAKSGNLEVVKLLMTYHADVDDVVDQTGQTPLCFASFHGHEAIVEFLFQSGAAIDGKFPDPVDKKPNEFDWKSSPLFASCINGHVRVVKYLLENGADVTVDKRYGDDEDRCRIEGNCLVLAILLGQKDVALCIVTSRKWKSALRWRASKDKYAKCTPLKLLISEMPDVAEVVLNNCIKTIKKQNGTYVKKYYYEFLEDFHSKTWPMEHPIEPNDRTHRSHHNWLHQSFKKEAHSFQVMINNKRIELLNHPLSSQLLAYKWMSYGIFIYFINLFIYLVFLAFLTTFMFSLQNPQTEECRPQVPNADCQGNGNEAFLVETAIVTITFSIIRIAIEAFQIIYYTNFCYFLEPENRMELYLYFLEPENWMELYLYPSSIAFVVFGLAADCQCPESWQWEFGAVTILMAWLNVVLFLKKFPYTGVYVLMFTRILKTILKMLLLPILCVVSFGITFYMLFFRPDMKTAFSSPANSILKTMMLTTGEFDFDDLFYNTEEEDSSQGTNATQAVNTLPAEVLFPVASYLLWIVFVIVMPIVLTNFLIGLAVDDIKGIQDESHLTCLSLKVDFILHIEKIRYIRELFLKRMDKNYYTSDIENFAYSDIENASEQEYTWFQRFKHCYFGRLKSHQDDIKVVDERSSTEQIKEKISDISVAVADVRKKVKDGINGKDIDTSQIGNIIQARELEEVKKMLADQEEKQKELSKMLVDQSRKQDLLLMYFKHLYPNLPEALLTATST